MLSHHLKHEIKKAIEEAIEKNDSISETISEYLLVNNEIDSDFLAQDILGDFDIDPICDAVEKVLLDRMLTFMVYPEMNDGQDGKHRANSEYLCPRCYRPFGQWVGSNNVSVNPEILQNGKSIIVI